MVQMDRMRPDPRPMKRRVSSSKYSTWRLASSRSLEAANRAMPTSLVGGSSSNNMAVFNIRLLFACCQLQDDPGIPFPARDPFAIQVFEQWDGVLARNTGPILEFRDRKLHALFLGKKRAEGFDRGCMKDQFVAHAD